MTQRTTTLMLLAFTISAAPLAFPGPSANTTSTASSPAPSISKSQAADIVKDTFDGKVLRVDEVIQDGAPLFRVKILQPGGRIKIVNINGLDGTLN